MWLSCHTQEEIAKDVGTNMKRRGLREIEEGRAIKKIMDKSHLTQKQVGERLGKSKDWVGKRLSLALDVIKEVQDAITRNVISVEQAVIIGQLPKNRQGKFLDLIIARQGELDRKLSADETRLELRRFLNDTIYTVGYEGWDLADFIKSLKDNKKWETLNHNFYSNFIAGIQLSYFFPFASTNPVQFIHPFVVSKELL